MSDTNQESFKKMEERLESMLSQPKSENIKSEDTTIKSIPAVISVL